jgi:hypothetical protein
MCLQRTCGFQVLAYYALLQELLLGSKCLHPHAGFHTCPVDVLDVSDVLLKELNGPSNAGFCWQMNDECCSKHRIQLNVPWMMTVAANEGIR